MAKVELLPSCQQIEKLPTKKRQTASTDQTLQQPPGGNGQKVARPSWKK